MDATAKDGRRYRVLLVADDCEHARRIIDIFDSSDICAAAVTTVAEPLEAVREVRSQPYDSVLLVLADEHQQGLNLLDALRIAECRSPVIVLGPSDERLAGQIVEQGADDYLVRDEINAICLPRHVLQAITRHSLASEKARLESEQRQRLLKEKAESEKIIAEQRRIIQELEERQSSDPMLGGGAAAPALLEWSRRGEIQREYLALARSYVVMGNDSLGERLAEFAAWLAAQDVTAAEVLDVHLGVVETMADGLSQRGAAHVVSRAGMLVLEVMVRLTQEYQLRQGGWENDTLELMLVTGDDQTCESLQDALADCKLRNSLTVADSAEVACDILADAAQTGAAFDLVLWDADTMASEDVPWIEQIAFELDLEDVWHVLVCTPGQLPLVPTDLPRLAGKLTKPITGQGLLTLIAAMPDRWLSVCKLAVGAGVVSEQ